MKSVFKLGLIAVLLLTVAAPPAGAQGDVPDDTTFALAIIGAIVVLVVGFYGAGTLLAVGLDYAIPDGPVKLAVELVDINLAPAKVSVSAEYVFQNDAEGDKKWELTYPFGRGRGVGPAANVAVTDGAGTEIPFAWKKKEITFGVTVPAKSSASVVVKYEQPVSGTTFTYPLGKDRFWGLAGAHTAFTVTAPAAFGDVGSSYPLKKVSAEGGAAGYVFVRDDFYPQMNFALRWENAAPATP